MRPAIVFFLFTAGVTAQSPDVSIATVPNTCATPTPTASGLPGLVAQIPSCAVVCFASAARQVNCDPADFSCLCRAGNAASLGLNAAGCLGGGQLLTGGDNNNNDDNDNNDNDDDDANDRENECELDDLDDLAQLATRICTAVAANPGAAQLAAATSVVSEALARASSSISATAAAPADSGRPNGAVRVQSLTATGQMLAAVAAFAAWAL